MKADMPFYSINQLIIQEKEELKHLKFHYCSLHYFFFFQFNANILEQVRKTKTSTHILWNPDSTILYVCLKTGFI